MKLIIGIIKLKLFYRTRAYLFYRLMKDYIKFFGAETIAASLVRLTVLIYKIAYYPKYQFVVHYISYFSHPAYIDFYVVL